MQALPPPQEDPVIYAPVSPPISTAKILKACRRYWWVLLLCTSIPVAAAFYYLKSRPTQYMSRATAWVRGKIRLSDVGQFTEDVQTFYGTLIELLRSEHLERRAIERIQKAHPEIEIPKRPNGLLDLPDVRIYQTPKSSVIVLDSISRDAAFSQAYLEALMEEFFQYRKEVRMSTQNDALGALSSQILKQESELKLAQDKLAQFQKENNIALLEESMRGGGGTLAQMNGQIANLKLDLQLLEAAMLEKQAGIEGRTNASPSVSALAVASSATASTTASHADYAAAQQQVELLRIQKEQLGRYLRPKHPKMVRLSDDMSRAEQILQFHKSRNAEQIAAMRQANTVRLRELEAASKILAEKVGEANRKLAVYEQLRSDIARQQVYYERLISLIQGVGLNSNMTQEDVAILEPASPGRPPKSKLVPMLAGTGVGGLAIGIGFIFLLVRLDDRCETLTELRARFPEPVFGQIPDVVTHRRLKGQPRLLPVVSADDDRHIFLESCRSLRSSLLFGLLDGNRPRVIAVTSTAPDEGKSTIALNLASTLALGGASVLLIDADTRRGHLHKHFGLKVEPGLRECILSGGDLEGFVQPIGTQSLWLLSRGKNTIAGEIFLDPAFEQLLNNAKARFQFVVIDTVPVLAADDTMSLAPKADGVLFVVRRAHTSAKLAQEALNLLYQRNAKVLGIVFNRADSSSGSYTYYKYSKYSKPDVDV